MSWMNFVVEQWVLVVALVVLAVAYFALNAGTSGKTVSIHEVTRLLNTENAILLDVRDAADFKAGHITGAININFTALAARLGELEKQRGKTIIVADKIGQQSAAAGKILLEKGFQVVRLSGGMSEWTAQNLPLVKK